MENDKMGQFIAECRKEKKLTQKQMAEKLFITDKAISKWERGLSCPDVSILPAVADILGVSVEEILNGERGVTTPEKLKLGITSVIAYAKRTSNEKKKLIKNISAITFSVLLLIGIMVSMICDRAIFGDFTWSMIVVESSILGWLIFFPLIIKGLRAIPVSLIFLCIAIIPYFIIFEKILDLGQLFFKLSIHMSVIGIIALWVVYFVFKIFSKHISIAIGITFLLAIAVNLCVGISLSLLIDEPVIDIVDIILYASLLLAAIGSFAIGKGDKEYQQVV